MDSNSEDSLTENMKKDNEFFKSMIDLIPPKFYFDREQLNEALSHEEASHDGGQKRKGNEEDLSQKSKWKRARFDPTQIKTVSQLQGVILAQEEKDEQESQAPAKIKAAKLQEDLVEVKSSTESLEDLRARLHAKIESMQAKRKALGREDELEKKRLARRVSKMKLKMKRAEQKHKTGDHKGAAGVNGLGSPKGGTTGDGKPIFNKEGKVVFSKFDFSDFGQNKKDAPKGKKYKKLLEKVNKDKEKLEQLKETDQEKAKTLQEKALWQMAIQKAEGVKIKDDPKLLKKSIKKQEQKKRKSKKEWTDRKEKLDKKLKDKQDKRKKNIQTKKQSRIDKKIKKSKKKGHIIPGF